MHKISFYSNNQKHINIKIIKMIFTQKTIRQGLFKFIIIISITNFLTKLVNSNNSTDFQKNKDYNLDLLDNGFKEVKAKFDKTNNKIIIDGIIYDVRDPSAIESNLQRYKYLKTNQILLNLVNVFSKILII